MNTQISIGKLGDNLSITQINVSVALVWEKLGECIKLHSAALNHLGINKTYPLTKTFRHLPAASLHCVYCEPQPSTSGSIMVYLALDNPHPSTSQ